MAHIYKIWKFYHKMVAILNHFWSRDLSEIVKIEFGIIKNPVYPISLALYNKKCCFWNLPIKAAILSHFRSCDLSEIFKVRFCIIKNPILPSFIGLIVLKMMSPETIAKWRPF